MNEKGHPVVEFSVVIPTLQRSPLLGGLIDMFGAHPLVGEIIVINNAQTPLPYEHAKLRVLDQERNIFVNPAWNLGAREARADHLIISNDDLVVPPQIIDALAAKLRRGRVGMIGPDASCFLRRRSGRAWFMPIYRRTWGYGTFMVLPTRNYVPIPEDLTIWCGDSWLFDHQPHRNFAFRGVAIETPIHVTSADPEFDAMDPIEERIYLDRYQQLATYPGRYAWEGRALHATRESYRWVKRNALDVVRSARGRLG